MARRAIACALATFGAVVACGSSPESDFKPLEQKAEEPPPSPSDTFGTSSGSTSSGGAGDSGNPGDKVCAVDADCGAGGVCNPATKTCGCGGQAVSAEIVPPNLLIVLDRSCSMTNKVGAVTKWDIAVAALKSLLVSQKSKIRFGLELFPDRTGNSCAQDANAVSVAPDKEAAISTILTAALTKGDPNFPDGPCVTNIDTAMETAKAEPSFTDKTRKNFAILITDGKQAGCNLAGGDAGTTQIIKDMKAAGVDTFVVGFGSGVDVAQMNIWATEGGQPNPKGTPLFYDASDQASLDLALATIAKKTLSCSLKLGQPPPGGDAGLVYVFVDKSPTPMPRDATKAARWDYDAATNSVTFYGADCTNLKDGKVSDVQVVFGCPGGPPPQPPVK